MKIYSKNLNASRRKGATAVEFALVAPIVFLTFFSLVELARLTLSDGNASSAILVGAREATLEKATPTSVKQEITKELAIFNISDSEIQLTPATFNADTPTVKIDLTLPLNGSNGFSFTSLVNSSYKIQKTIEVKRESGR